MPTHTPPRPNFETSLAELERIVTTMESGQLPLNDALTAYQRGIVLLRQCQQTLNHVDLQIQQLEIDDDAGNGVSPP